MVLVPLRTSAATIPPSTQERRIDWSPWLQLADVSFAFFGGAPLATAQLLQERVLVGDTPVPADPAVAEPLDLHLPDVDRMTRRRDPEERPRVPARQANEYRHFVRRRDDVENLVAETGESSRASSR